MSLSNFTIAKMTENGSWVHLEIEGKPLYQADDLEIGFDETDKPARVHLKSVADPELSKALKEMTRTMGVHKWAEDRATKDNIAEVMKKNEVEFEAKVKSMIGAAVSEWENISVTESDETRIATQADRALVLSLVGVNSPFWFQIYKALLGQKLVFKSAAID